MQPTDLLILALAVFLLGYSIAYLEMPFGIARRVRDRFPQSTLVRCIYCLSPWIAIVLYAIYPHPEGTVGMHLVNILGIAGGAVMWFRYTGGSHV